MARKFVTINVDKKFFDNKFEAERIKMQKRLGLINLPQTTFTKMIEGFKIKMPKFDIKKIDGRRKKKHEFKV